MDSTPSLSFQLNRGDSPRRSLQVVSRTVLIGSAAHCDIRVLSPDVAPEHVRVRCGQEAVTVELCSIENSTWLDGVPVVRAIWRPGARLRIGDTELSVVADRIASTRRKSKLGGAMALLVPLVIVAVLLWKPHSTGEPEVAPMELPDLWDKLPTARCAESSRVSQIALARRSRSQAEAARERAPFAPRDGVRAVQLFLAAAVCFEASGSGDNAQAARVAAIELKRELNAEFHVHAVRLERALVARRVLPARRQVAALTGFLSDGSGQYARYLRSVDRYLQLAVSEKDTQ